MAYLGLRFNLDKQVHYGWARVKAIPWLDQNHGLHVNATLLGYAYQTVPNQSIKAGQKTEVGAAGVTSDRNIRQPGTLGALALGSAQEGSCLDFEPFAKKHRSKTSR